MKPDAPIERAASLVRNETIADEWTDRIVAWYATKPPGWTTLLKKLVAELGAESDQRTIRQVSAALKALGWRCERRGVGVEREYRWIPPRLPKKVVDREAAPATVDASRRDTKREILDRICAERLFPEQLAYVLDEGPRVWAFTPRRGGKTEGAAFKLARGAILYPQNPDGTPATSLFVGLTGGHAEMIMRGALERAVYALGGGKVDYNQQKHTGTLDNGHVIRIVGLNANPTEQEKQLGGKFHRCALDECQSQVQDLERIANEVLGQAVTDNILHGGGLDLLGTPGLRMGTHFWWRLTKQDEAGEPSTERLKGWVGHEWPVTANPWMREQFEAEKARLREAWGSDDFLRDPGFRRQWLGKWVLELESRVYRFVRAKNTNVANDVVDAGAAGVRGSSYHAWHFLMGVDLGWEDATAVVVVGYRHGDRRLYIIRSEKRRHATYEEVGAWLTEWCALYGPQRIVIDSAGVGKQLARSLAARYKLAIVPAGKTDKQDHVARMNGDFSTGLVQVIEGDNKDLVREWEELVLDPKKRELGEWAEHPRLDNHLCDAALYAWRDAQHYHERDKPAEPKTTIDKKLEQVARRKRREWMGARREGRPVA